MQPTVADISHALEAVKLDVLQIYGSTDDLHVMKQHFGLPVWHAIGVTTAADLPSGNGGADRLLLEAKAPAGATRPGGNATTFDWSILRGWAAPAPWMLAGGLTVENVADAIRQTAAVAVDVSSGVEKSKGLKDPVLIRRFIAAAKGLPP